MTIEPLSSAMTYQAQQAPRPAERPDTGNTDVSVMSMENTVDKTTAAVKASEGKENQENSGGSNSQQPSQDKVKKAVDQMNKKMQNSEAIFGIHDETQRVTIKIVDKQTKEVIKELPPEKTLDMIAKIWEMAGILVDEKR